MATGFILSLDAGNELDRVLQSIADRVQAIRRTCTTVEQLCSGIPRDAVGCIFFEDTSEGGRSDEFCDLIGKHQIRRPSVIVMHHSRIEAAARAVRCGAVAVHSTAVTEEELERAIREALAVSSLVRDSDRRARGVTQQLDRLSEGELLVLRLVLDGQLNKRIANKLDISERTVEARRKRIFEKTRTESVAQLVREIVETVGMDDILLRCGEPVKQPPAPHWNRMLRPLAAPAQRSSGMSQDPRQH